MTTATQTPLTINEIQRQMRARDSHWWDPASMRFFGTRTGSRVYSGPGGIYFVTSEKPPHGPRQYTVRQYLPVSAEIETIGELASMSRHAAHGEAERLASKDVHAQLAAALRELDRAVTGSTTNSTTTYGSAAEIAAGGSQGVVYLSDGGYTRLIARRYDDDSGYYLELVATPDSDDANTRQRFADAYKLQRQVCRLLQTWEQLQATGEVETADEELRPVTEKEQFIADLRAHGCTVTDAVATLLMQRAATHQRLMEDCCNTPEASDACFDADGNEQGRLLSTRQRIGKLAREIGATGVIFSGDPRGCTVKLVLPDGATNDWGREGWCVP